MHDPLTVAFEIRLPFGRTSFGYRPSFITIWHRDPEKRGDDDSCDWFGRRRNLNKREAALEQAWVQLSDTLGNAPFYPDKRLYGLAPHAEGNSSPVQDMERAFYSWRRRGRRWHPRWHVHHWRFQVHPAQKFKRWAFSRCAGCGLRFTWGYAPVSGSWYSGGPRWFRNEPGVYHSECYPPRPYEEETK